MVRAARSATSARTDRIVGRAEQRAQLARTLDDVIDDGSRFVIIGGDAGVGKTTVVEAFVAGLFGPLADRKAQLIRGQCVPMGGEGLPYAPIVGALRDLVTQHGREQMLEWAGAGWQALGALLPDLVAGPPRDADDTIRLQLFEAVTMLLERASENGPLVVIIEDIHWADESTRHLLRFLARALTDAPVMIITTYRSDELTRRHPLRPFLAEVGRFPNTVRLELPGLDRAEVAELLTQLMERPPNNVVIDLVYKRSEGIPYFVEELTRSAARGCIDMPDTLRDALNVRVLSLSDRTQQTLQLAAVAGNRVDHGLLEAAADASDGELEAQLREAIDAAVLTADETGYAFRHALLREVVHDDLLPGQHARLHARFATILEEHPELMSAEAAPMEIAHHWNAAHQVNKAFRWALTAAESGAAAFHECLKLYERALELWDQVDDPESVAGPHASLLMRAAYAAEDAGEIERYLALVNAALDELDPESDRLERIEALLLKSRAKASLMTAGGVEPLREALRLLPEDADPTLRARVLEMLARRTLLEGDLQQGLEFARRAVDAAAVANSDSATANAWITLGISLAATGQETEGIEVMERVGQLVRTSARTLLRFFVNYSDALNHVGRYEDAVREALRGVDMARDLGLQRSMGAMLAGNAAEPLLALGQWARASAMIERALELDPPAHHHAHLRLLQAWLHVWRGQLDEADAILTEFRPMIRNEKLEPQYTSQVIRTDAEYALAVGDHRRAWSDVKMFLDHSGHYHRAMFHPVLAAGAAAARVLDQSEGSDQRLALIRNFLDHQTVPVRIHAFWEPVIRAELEDTAQAWRSALDELGTQPAPAHLRPYAGLRLGQHLVAGRERTEAKQVLATASAEAVALGSTLLSDRIGALSQRAGFVVAPPPEESPVVGLTPREIEVLQLVAAGRSNGEIGNALFISTKTASVHVSNILAKLGVSGRGEAAALAHRIGLTAP
jgi:ATP/maltotriose-dependent transcriptional regulator MalT